MKKVLAILAFVAISMGTFAANGIEDLTGKARAAVNKEVSKGAEVVSFDFQPIYYIMQPTGTYISGYVTVTTVKNVDLGGGVFTRAITTITCDEVVTKQGTLRYTNVAVN